MSTLRVVRIDFRTDPRWEAFVSSHPDALIYHHPAWLESLEREYGQQCIALACEDQDHMLRAILPLARTRGLPFHLGRSETGKRMSSLPRTPIAGPLWCDREARVAILKHALDLARSEPGLRLELKSPAPDLAEDAEGLECVPWRPTYVQEIPPLSQDSEWAAFWESVRIPRVCGPCADCRKLRFGNAKRQHKINWAVNKAVKNGLQVREATTQDELLEWYVLYLKTMRHNAVPPRTYRFFVSLWSSMRPKQQLQLLVAERTEGGRNRIIAGSMLLKFGQTVFYAFTGCDPADFCLHPHDILQLHAIRDACKSGFRWYDFGEVTEDNEALIQFKSKWGTEPQRLYRYYFPSSRQSQSDKPRATTQLARRVWRRLPEKITAILGDWIYSFT